LQKFLNLKKMKRTIVKIDESRCNGCGACVTGCHEGALQIIDGKARIVSDMYCDGLGACIGDCPEGAITLEEREAEPFNEQEVMKRMASLQEKPCGCPGAREMSFEAEQNETNVCVSSQLRQWPIQLHLLNPGAPFLKNANMVLAADCTAFAYGDFHNRFMKNNSIAIACPKLDHDKEIYIEKLTAMIDYSTINTLTVIMMEVPCCRGLLQMAQQAQTNAKRKIPVKKVIVGIQGEIQSEEWA
jgi:NAD-dependent dihydropyrimidine dehydrogenase PreA subunit